MHGDPVGFAIECSQQSHNLALVLLPQQMETPGAVLPLLQESNGFIAAQARFPPAPVENMYD